jgi:hypothetical protein
MLQSLNPVLYIVIAGSSGVKSPDSNAQSSCSNEWLAIKSQKSSNSGSTSGEKINVRTTHRQLVWGSVAVGKSVTKSFAVRSEDSCRLAVYVYVEDKLHSYEVSFTFKQKLKKYLNVTLLCVQLMVQLDVFICILYSSVFLSSKCFGCCCTHPQELQL